MKRFFALILSLAICISVISVLAVIPASAVSHLERDKGLTMTEYTSKNKGYSSDYYETEKHLDEVPHSFEAWVFLSSSLGGAKAGTIIGNDSAKGGGRFSFGMAKNYAPNLVFKDKSGASHSVVFNNSAILTGDWYHIVIVWDQDSGEFRCHINGELKETIPISDTCGDKCKDGCLGVFSLESARQFPIALAGDFNYLNAQYFRGALQDVAMYSDVLSADEIRANYLNGVNAEDENLILYYDINSTDKKQNIYDLSGNGYHMLYSNAWVTEEEMQKIREEKGYAGEYEYSMAIIGDPQYATKSYPATVRKMYQWIADNKEAKNIQYLIGLGDITDQCQEKEWLEATDALKIIENANIEYTFVRGNHDKGYSIEEVNKDTIAPELYDELFAGNPFYVDQFKENGGFYEEGSVVNVYRTLTIHDDNWLIITLDFQADKSVRDWAGEILKQYPEHRAILVTHEYLGGHGNPSSYGEKLWDEVVSKHENVEMVLCGHVSWDNIEVTQTQGENGNTVTQILVDPQNIDLYLSGVGIVAMFYFSKDGTVIDIEYYSAVKDRYFKHCNQIVVDLRAESEPKEYKWDGAESIAPEGSGTESDPFLISNAANLLWMAEQHYTLNSENALVSPNGFTNPFEGKYFLQTAEIDLYGYTLPSIGYYFESDNVGAVFGGYYDGGGYAIRNGKIENPLASAASTGLFAECYGATVSNLTLKEITVASRENTGILIGRANGCTVESCKITANCKVLFANSATKASIGAFVGKATSSSILSCESFADISLADAYASLGGIVGSAMKSVIYDSVFDGELSISYTSENLSRGVCGAIVGEFSENVTIVGCKNKTDIKDYNGVEGATPHTANEWRRADGDVHSATCLCGCGKTIQFEHILGDGGYCRYCELDITGASVSLGSEISINYHVSVADASIVEGKALAMRFSINGTTVTVSDFTEKGGKYVFSLKGIAPQEIGDSIDAALIIKSGEEETVACSKNGYSIKKYCVSLLDEYKEDEKLVQLVEDLLFYGAAAQAYKEHNTHSFVTGGLTISASDVAPTEAEKTSVAGNTNSACRVTARNVNHDGKIEISVSLHIEDISLAEIKLDGEKYDTSRLESLGEGNYALKISNIMPYQINEMHELVLSYDGEVCTTLGYGINSYVYLTVNKITITEELHQRFAIALYRYGNSAKEYVNATEAEK